MGRGDAFEQAIGLLDQIVVNLIDKTGNPGFDLWANEIQKNQAI